MRGHSTVPVSYVNASGNQPFWTHDQAPNVRASDPQAGWARYHTGYDDHIPTATSQKYTNPDFHDGFHENFGQIDLPGKSASEFSTGSTYSAIDISHREITEKDTDYALCSGCVCPMKLKLRMEPCYHLLCYECLPLLTTDWESRCPNCQETVEILIAVHPKDKLHLCSGRCRHDLQLEDCHWRSPGKAFLNACSLACHEMFFHEEVDPSSAQDTQTNSALPPGHADQDRAVDLEQIREVSHPNYSSEQSFSGPGYSGSHQTPFIQPSHRGSKDVRYAYQHPYSGYTGTSLSYSPYVSEQPIPASYETSYAPGSSYPEPTPEQYSVPRVSQAPEIPHIIGSTEPHVAHLAPGSSVAYQPPTASHSYPPMGSREPYQYVDSSSTGVMPSMAGPKGKLSAVFEQNDQDIDIDQLL